ncbi:MAG TPA: prepilin-type N-terminal cleavage/methylation domain-containing protein [Armatimonadota bacterium]
MFSKVAAHRRGFTLIEMLIVIVVIAILALIVISRLLSASRQGQEAALRADLTHLRTAIAAFEADCGTYPASLDDVVASQPGPATGVGGEPIRTGNYKGPYLTPSGGIDGSGIPQNPFAGATATVAQNWSYTATSGLVNSAITGTTLDGVAYTNL